MKKSTPILITLVALGGVFSVEAQTSKIPEPSLPGYSGFHSNLGIQEIVEVGVPLSTKRKPTQVKIEDLKQPIDPETGKTSSFPSPSLTPSFENSNRPAVMDSGAKKDWISITPQVGLRAYRTSNVLRAEEGMEKGSGVFETNIGLGISSDAGEISPYLTLIPRLDLMMQWARYGENADLLNYRFGLVKGGVALGFPNDWSAGLTLDYNVLHNQKTGDRTFDSFSPAISLQKLFVLSDTSFIMGDMMLRNSSTDQTVTFPAAGVFADSGDNRQNSFSLTYIQLFGDNGEFTFMPRLSYTRTRYLKSPSEGRDDNLFTIGASMMYQWTDWLSAQTFLTNSSMSSDTIPNFSAFDFGVSLSASHRF